MCAQERGSQICIRIGKYFYSEHRENTLALVCKVAAKCGVNASNRKVRLKVLKSGYLMEEYIPTIRSADVERGFIREPVKYKKGFREYFRKTGLEPMVMRGTVFC